MSKHDIRNFQSEQIPNDIFHVVFVFLCQIKINHYIFNNR